MPLNRLSVAVLMLATVAFAAPAGKTAAEKKPTKSSTITASQFIAAAERDLEKLADKQQRADWVSENFITDDTEAIAADADQVYYDAIGKYANAARKHEKQRLSPEDARKIYILKSLADLPLPSDPAKAERLTKLKVNIQGIYGKGQYCPPSKSGICYDLTAMERAMGDSRDPDQLKDLWVGWHKISPPMREKYREYVELANEGAREQGFADFGAMWRSRYDMPPDAFAKDVDRLWEQVKPFYLSLHAYVRSQLRKNYGPSAVPAEGPIPAHLLGNMWAQEWGNIYPIVKPQGSASTYDLAELLKEKNVDAHGMVHYGENFFKSLSLQALPPTFWERSLFVKPKDRDVVCHASAWDVDNDQDVRLKMCIQVRGEDFITIHHELGHNYYQLAYRNQPFLFKDSANDGFHEAIGDTIALSVTPEYLQKVGLLKDVPAADGDIPFLLHQALDKIAFLPFGLLIDQWRWKVFSGEIKPEDYNKAWWELRLKYQGIAPPVERSEADFDPGAKYHIPANVPYTRYFLARIYQFQFHRALCEAAGFKGPLHRCSIYGNRTAGEKLEKTLALGRSKPWQQAMQQIAGTDQADATAILDYFAPLKKWLDEQNAKNGVKVGW